MLLRAWLGFTMCALSACSAKSDLEDALEDLEEAAPEPGESSAETLVDLEAQIEEQIENLDVEFSMVHTRFDSSTGEFTELTPPSVERNLLSAVLLGGDVYALGGLKEDGDYSNALERYDAASDTWEERSPRPRSGFAFDAVVSGLLCSVGGYLNLDEPIRREVECYDPSSDEWSSRQDVPSGYAEFVPVAADDLVFIPGGLDENGDPVDTNRVYDPASDEWSERAPLPFGFLLGGAVVLDGKIYLVGGFKVALQKDDEPASRDMLVYDIANDEWTLAPDMPNARALYGVDAVEGHVTAFFGLTEAGAPLVDFYDPAADAWFPGSDPPEPPDGGVYTYARHLGQMHLFTLASGTNGEGTTSNGELWRYSVTDDAWSVVGTRRQGEDALFYGVSRGEQLHFVGAHTTVVY
jgi:hypothetical protein